MEQIVILIPINPVKPLFSMVKFSLKNFSNVFFFPLVCKEKGQDGIINFHEVSSCYYEMTVTLSKLCNIPAFR